MHLWFSPKIFYFCPATYKWRIILFRKYCICAGA